MNTIVVWLLIVTGSNGSASTISQHPTQASCEQTRAEAIGKVRYFFEGSSACVRATVVSKS